ncbi:hypothetical protein Anapl_06959 [Anas platyrhynchos]|uniref:Uncharacterized protein n=1 Tax=Anas platyrhynchos TaxID=8839 RepID=R0LAE4_ANAPL|nr:hypothetical protein Anapl_06959 [Anas platyrhynchos]
MLQTTVTNCAQLQGREWENLHRLALFPFPEHLPLLTAGTCLCKSWGSSSQLEAPALAARGSAAVAAWEGAQASSPCCQEGECFPATIVWGRQSSVFSSELRSPEMRTKGALDPSQDPFSIWFCVLHCTDASAAEGMELPMGPKGSIQLLFPRALFTSSVSPRSSLHRTSGAEPAAQCPIKMTSQLSAVAQVTVQLHVATESFFPSLVRLGRKDHAEVGSATRSFVGACPSSPQKLFLTLFLVVYFSQFPPASKGGNCHHSYQKAVSVVSHTIPDKTGCLASPHPDIQHSACPVVGRVWVEETETNGEREESWRNEVNVRQVSRPALSRWPSVVQGHSAERPLHGAEGRCACPEGQ